jgi:hypothetical protein
MLLPRRVCFGSSNVRVSCVLFTVPGIVISAQADCFGNIHDASRLCATCIPILVATSILGINPALLHLHLSYISMCTALFAPHHQHLAPDAPLIQHRCIASACLTGPDLLFPGTEVPVSTSRVLAIISALLFVHSADTPSLEL